MATRNKTDLNEILWSAYDKAVIEWARVHPQLPQPFITCAYRSNDEQNILFEQGVKDPSKKVTNAKGGESPHNYLPSQAFDIAFIKLDKTLDWNQELFKEFAKIIEVIQPLIEWGGEWKWKDTPHYQMKNWRNFIKAKV